MESEISLNHFFKKGIMKLYVKIIWMTAFAVAMGFLEGAVVVYLRKIYYPEGFHFPLVPIELKLALTEIVREFSTLVMLIAVAVLIGRSFTERFAWFLFSFGVWDIFYYVFLKIILGWPESFGTWDILFMIPVPWVGIVFEPVLLSLLMIIFSVLILIFSEKNPSVKIKGNQWSALITGSVLVIISFTADYITYVFSFFSFGEVFSPENNKAMMEYISDYIPERNYTSLFSIGVGLIFLAILDFFIKNRNEIRGKS